MIGDTENPRYDEDGKIVLTINCECGFHLVWEWEKDPDNPGRYDFIAGGVESYGAPEDLARRFDLWASEDPVRDRPEIDCLCREFRAYLDPMYVLENAGGSDESPATCPVIRVPKYRMLDPALWPHDLREQSILEIRPHIAGYLWSDQEPLDGEAFGIPDWLDLRLSNWAFFHDWETQEIWPGEGEDDDIVFLGNVARAYIPRKHALHISGPGIDGTWVWPSHRMGGTFLLQIQYDVFSPEAEKVWLQRPPEDRKRILNDVWCPSCQQGRSIENYAGTLNDQGEVVLTGTCGGGHPLTRKSHKVSKKIAYLAG